jgi:hypothetical protein
MVPSTNENILPIAKDIVKEVRRNEKDVKKAGSARMSNKLRKRGPLPETEDCYFKVVDVSLDGTMIEDRGKCGFMRDLEMFYKTIPAQPKGTIRILLDGRPYSLGPRVTRPHLNCFDNGNDFVDPEPATTCPLYPSSRLPAESQHPHFVLFRNMWAEDGSSSCWHRTDAFVMHRLLCAHHPETKHLLQIETDMYEKSEIFVRVCRDIAGNPMGKSLLFCPS